jgi:hypothetical protein
MALRDDHSMHSPQTSLKGNPFRPYEDHRPADKRLDPREFHALPTVTKSARAMLKHWPKRDRQARLIRRPA